MKLRKNMTKVKIRGAIHLLWFAFLIAPAQANDSADLNWNVGKKLYAKEQYEEAVKYFDKALKLDPHHTWAHYDRGMAEENCGKFKEGIADFTKELEVNPKWTDSYVKRAECYFGAGQLLEGAADYDRAMKCEPNVGIRCVYLRRQAIGYLRLGRYRDAIANYNKVLATYPENDGSLFNRITAYMGVHEYANAAKDCTTLIARAPNDEDGYKLRADAYAKMGNLKAALADYTRAIDLMPEFAARALEGRADVYERLGKKAQAEQDRIAASKIKGK